jgi:hypothetical protein
VAADKITPIAAAAEFRAAVQAYEDAGWHVADARFQIDVAGGAALYLIDIESARIVLVTLKRGALEDLARKVAALGVPFDEACNHFGTLFTWLIEGRTERLGADKNDLAVAAGVYIIGTQSYAVGMPRMTFPQFLVLRLPDREHGGHMLRPVPLIKAIPMTPEELVEVTNTTLQRDREKHPARFGRGQVIPFTLKPKL